MKIVGIIPARYHSSRFEGKPLANIHGKPMVWWVYNEAKKEKKFDNVYIATDDKRIEEVCNQYDLNVIMTSKRHKTGTDRVVEAAKKIPDYDIYVVVMGDEPAIQVKDINKIVNKMEKSPEADAAMLVTKFKNGVDVINPSTIKLAINNQDELIYMSRQPIPFPKGKLNYDFYKNVGVYAFSKKGLNFFEKTAPGCLENIEEMEMLRMLENHKIVKTVYVDTDAMSVDTPKDLDRIKLLLKKRLKNIHQKESNKAC